MGARRVGRPTVAARQLACISSSPEESVALPTTMLAKLLVALCAASAASFAAGPAGMPLRSPARAVSPNMQFGTGNAPKNNGFFLSPIASGSKDYPYGEYEVDTSGEFPAKFFALFGLVLFPVAFAVGIATASV